MRRYSLEKKIELSAWITTIILLLSFVPKNKVREAHVAFLFKQLITWLFGLVVVEKKLIAYPSRLFFKKTNKSSFTFEYFVYPALCALFNVHFPENQRYLYKISHYIFYSSIITLFELFAIKYTKLITYKKWTWYYTFITLWITFFFSRMYHKWFYRIS